MKNLAILATLCLLPVSASAAGLFDSSTASNWSGGFVGANAGAAVNNNRTNYSYTAAPGNGTGNFSDAFGNAAENAGASGSDGPLNISGLTGVQSAIAQGIIPAYLGSNQTDFIGGGQIGYNWQNSAVVLGVVADFAWLSQGSASTFTGTIPSAYTNSGGSQSTVDWLGTARVRAGYALDRFLPYVTGGLAFGSTKASSYSTGTDGSTTDTFAGSRSNIRPGWTLGGGVDYQLFGGWSAQVEGLYYDLGTARYNLGAQDANTVAEGLTSSASHKFDGEIVRLAINYSF